MNSHEDREESFHENFHPKTLFVVVVILSVASSLTGRR